MDISDLAKGWGGSVKSQRSPLEIQILLHYYVSRADHPNLGYPALHDVVENFLSKGLLVERQQGDSGDGAYEITDGGRLYVQTLMDVPLPVQKWVMP